MGGQHSVTINQGAVTINGVNGNLDDIGKHVREVIRDENTSTIKNLDGLEWERARVGFEYA
jgi:hypothetical protein